MIAVPLLAVALLGLAASGCYRHNYGPSPVPPPGPPNAAKINHHVLWGIIGVNNHTSPRRICGGPPVYVQDYVGILGVLLGALTAGIYVPTVTRVWCAGPRAETPAADGERASR